MDDCKDTEHRCQNCHTILATVSQSGSVRVQQPVMVKSAYVHPQQPQLRDAGTAELDAVDNKIIAQEADSIPQSELGRNGSVLRAVYELGVPAAVQETMKRPVVSEPGAADWHS